MAQTNASRKLINKLIEVGKFIDIFIMCLKRRKKEKKEDQKDRRIMTEYNSVLDSEPVESKKEKEKEELRNILKRIDMLEKKLGEEK